MFFFSSRRRHTRCLSDWSSDVCSSDLSFAWGKGLVTAAASLDFARNRLIGEHDHAEFLWLLLDSTAAPEFDVFFRPERLSLWQFLVDPALDQQPPQPQSLPAGKHLEFSS